MSGVPGAYVKNSLMPKPSERSGKIPASPFRKLVPLAEEAKHRGLTVHHLNIGQPDIPTPPAALQSLREAPLEVLAYGPAAGLPSYRTKLAGYYGRFGVQLDPSQVIITTGASEALQLLFLAGLNPGEEIIAPEPFYANYTGFAQIAGVKIVAATSYLEEAFALPSAEALEALISPRTKAILINNPGNPTGRLYTRRALEDLAALVRKHDLFLFVDEVYREFCYDDQSFTCALSLPGLEEQVVVIDSVSKRYSACGARVGSVASRNYAILQALEAYGKLRLSPPVMGQMLAEAMLEADQTYLPQVVEEYDRRRRLVYRRLSAMPGVQSYLPGGAFYCFARLPVDDADRFCTWLLGEFAHHKATVMLSPGSAFYASPGRGTQEVRIAFVRNQAALENAMDCLEAGLAAYPGREDQAVYGVKADAPGRFHAKH